MGLAAMSASGIGMMLFYLVAYLFGNMGAFFVVQAVARFGRQRRDRVVPRPGAPIAGARAEPAACSCCRSAAFRSWPGFWAKLFIFWAVVERGHVLARVPRRGRDRHRALLLPGRRARMYIDPPARPDPIRVPGVLFVAILLCVAGVVIMGLYPDPWVAEALRAAAALF